MSDEILFFDKIPTLSHNNEDKFSKITSEKSTMSKPSESPAGKGKKVKNYSDNEMRRLGKQPCTTTLLDFNKYILVILNY